MKDLTKDEFIQLLVYVILDEIDVDFDTIKLNHMKDTPIDVSKPYTVPKSMLEELYNKYKGESI
jgi:hypothetical protein